MNLRLIGIICILFFSMFSCKKDEVSGVSISGQVKDARTGEGVSNVKIELSAQGFSDGVFNSNYQKIRETTSSSDGSYSFEFDFNNAASYRFELEGQLYYNVTHEYNPDDLPPGADNVLNLPIDSRAWVRLIIQNQDPVVASESITFGYNTETVGCNSCCTNEVYEYFGSTSVSNTCEVYGGSYAVASGFLFNPIQGQQPFTDSTFCVPRDTTDFLITF